MATDIRNTGLGTLATSTTPVELTINSARDYHFHHPGINPAGAATDTIVLALISMTMDSAVALQKFFLTPGVTVIVRRGVGSAVFFASLAGTPNLQYAEGELEAGQ